uniref:Uncharacterized protein n=1 Tax=Anguilla anguilla TaxID=7936 RepID=A0A0E9SI93_ANGAN
MCNQQPLTQNGCEAQ